MTSIVSYDPKKDLPTPRTGARGFTATSGSVYLDPNTPTPISAEVLQELQQDPTFKALKEAGAIIITESSPPPELIETESREAAVFDLLGSKTEVTGVAESKNPRPKT